VPAHVRPVGRILMPAKSRASCGGLKLSLSVQSPTRGVPTSSDIGFDQSSVVYQAIEDRVERVERFDTRSDETPSGVRTAP